MSTASDADPASAQLADDPPPDTPTDPPLPGSQPPGYPPALPPDAPTEPPADGTSKNDEPKTADAPDNLLPGRVGSEENVAIHHQASAA
jgi:hypothetical protein